MNRRICIIEECGAELPEHGRSDFCANCRAMFSYWKKRSVARLEKYKRRLRKAESRIESMPGKAKPNLQVIEGGRKHGTG